MQSLLFSCWSCLLSSSLVIVIFQCLCIGFRNNNRVGIDRDKGVRSILALEHSDSQRQWHNTIDLREAEIFHSQFTVPAFTLASNSQDTSDSRSEKGQGLVYSDVSTNQPVLPSESMMISFLMVFYTVFQRGKKVTYETANYAANSWGLARNSEQTLISSAYDTFWTVFFRI